MVQGYEIGARKSQVGDWCILTYHEVTHLLMHTDIPRGNTLTDAYRHTTNGKKRQGAPALAGKEPLVVAAVAVVAVVAVAAVVAFVVVASGERPECMSMCVTVVL